MSGIVKSIGIALLFFASQIVGIVSVMLYTVRFHPEWYYKINEIMETHGMQSLEYLKCISEWIYPALFIGDLCLLIPFVIYMARKKSLPIHPVSKKKLADVFVLGMICNAVVSFVIGKIPSTEYDMLSGAVMQAPFLVALFTTGILTPIVEEFVFRYAVGNCVEKYGKNAAIFLSALLFGIAHMNLVQSVYAFLFGLILGSLYFEKKNLLPCIWFHIVVNAGSVLWEYWPTTDKIIPSVVVGICFLYAARKAILFLKNNQVAFCQKFT